MARLLISNEYPNGHELDAIFDAIRLEVFKGSSRMAHDGHPENRHLLGHVLESNSKVLGLVNEAKTIVESFIDTPPRPELVPVRVTEERNAFNPGKPRALKF